MILQNLQDCPATSHTKVFCLSKQFVAVACTNGSALIYLDFNFLRLCFPYTLISLYFNFSTLISLDYDLPTHSTVRIYVATIHEKLFLGSDNGLCMQKNRQIQCNELFLI